MNFECQMLSRDLVCVREGEERERERERGERERENERERERESEREREGAPEFNVEYGL